MSLLTFHVLSNPLYPNDQEVTPMFQPKLGVSLGTLSQTLTDEVLQAVAESQIATLEIGAALFDDAANRAQMPALKAMLQQHAVRPMTIH
ncbi:MAG: hypothetical protein B6I33_05130, partial [Propionibacterium sp. 4572_24]